MFSLDPAIASWRRTLEHRRALTSEDLDELEEHVRDYVDAGVAAGRSAEEAFHAAMRRFGTQDNVEAESSGCRDVPQ